jgi:putative serine protease PepD
MLRAALVYVVLGLGSAGLLACGGSDEPEATPTPEATATPEPPAELTAADVLEQNRASVLQIVTTSAFGEGGGSGVVWEDATHVLTNAHVVIGAGAIKVIDPADGSRSFPAKVVALSACDDVALLSVERSSGLVPAKFGDSSAVEPGERVITLGFPDTVSEGPSNPIVTEGTISRVGATFSFGGQRELLQHTAPINPGNSGGPLFNSLGEVIGLNSYAAIDRQSENYAISSNEALSVGELLKAGKNLDYIGISLRPNDEDFAFDNDLAYIDGLVITAVDPGSAAEQASPYPLETGFLVFEVNATPVYSVGDFCDVIRSRSSGETIRIRFGAFDPDGLPYNDFQYDVVVP